MKRTVRSEQIVTYELSNKELQEALDDYISGKITDCGQYGGTVNDSSTFRIDEDGKCFITSRYLVEVK